MYRKHLMFIAIIICILFLLGVSINMRAEEQQAIWSCSPRTIQSHQDFCTTCMDLWTKIDLVQAINSDHVVKQQVLVELVQCIRMLHVAAEKIKQPIYRSRESSYYDTISLILALKNAFEVVFKDTDPFLYGASLQLFNGMIEELVTPADIESEVPS